MLAAASMGATAFQKGLGAIHSLSHPVGALYDTHHGLTNAVFMPYVLAFNRPAIEDRLVRLAAWLGLKNPSFNARSEEHTSELQSLMRISYAVFCLKKKKTQNSISHKAFLEHNT